MLLKNLFVDAMDAYNEQRKQSPGVNSNASAVQIIENKIPKILTNQLTQYTNYIVKGSCGVGRWAEIPWITVMNTQVTTSVSKGYYLTYLFSGDMQTVYLAFMYAVTDNKELNRLIPKAQEILKKSSIGLNNNIRMGKISELGFSQRAKQYSKATVAYIQYSKSNIPENDSVWIDDLKYMISLYEEYMKKIGEDSFISPIDSDIDDDISIPYLNLTKLEIVHHTHQYLQSKGFRYSLENIKNLYLSLRSKPFVIISGISGTGKTKIVQLFAESIGATEANGRFKLIPVRPDWSDGSELLGYVDLKGDFKRGPLTEMIEHAYDEPDLPHFVLLDEMNLARVEYYFSDVLSVMESRRREGEDIVSSVLVEEKDVGRPLALPNNLYMIGTVNMDETTHPFSKKVLDRANTLEFNDIDLENFDFLTHMESVEPLVIANKALEASYLNVKDVYETHEALVKWVSAELTEVNRHLRHMKAEVGYRVRDEICFYMAWNEQEEPLLARHEAFDFCLMQKVLPRVVGSGQHVEETLQGLFLYLTNASYSKGMNVQQLHTQYPKSAQKVADMFESFIEVGFTSFWSA